MTTDARRAGAEERLVEAPELRAQVYERLRDAILTGELPAGSRVSPIEVAGRFGISTMPVRDALRHLEQDGLVETSARRWTRVVELDPDTVEEIVPLLLVLERHAILSAPELSGEILDRMRHANDDLRRAIADGDVARRIDADARFHDAVVELARNPSLERMVRDARARIRLLRVHAMRGELPHESVAEHEGIVERLATGDRQGAAALVGANWKRGLELVRVGS